MEIDIYDLGRVVVVVWAALEKSPSELLKGRPCLKEARRQRKGCSHESPR